MSQDECNGILKFCDFYATTAYFALVTDQLELVERVPWCLNGSHGYFILYTDTDTDTLY